jgi:hypothetical protein
VIRFATRPGNKQANEWLLNLLGRKPRKLVAVALGLDHQGGRYDGFDRKYGGDYDRKYGGDSA